MSKQYTCYFPGGGSNNWILREALFFTNIKGKREIEGIIIFTWFFFWRKLLQWQSPEKMREEKKKETSAIYF